MGVDFEALTLRHSTIVPRPRLLRQLRNASMYPVVLFIAPAGFGKTTAIRQLLEFCTEPIFISVPAGVTTLYQFMRSFAQGCSERFPAMAEPPVEFAVNLPAAKCIELYTTWAIAHLKNLNSVIAIDDLQNISPEVEISDFFVRLSEECKGHLKLVLASRTSNNLPLVRWQAYGEATTAISADDLRMTLDDAIELAKTVRSVATKDQLASWVEQTEGFPIPLSFAIRASTTHDNIHNIMHGARSLTFNFLVEHLWKSLSEEQRRLLELAAILPPTKLRDYVNYGIPRAAQNLGILVEQIAFLTLNDEVLFIHDLFRDFVKQELAQRDVPTLRSTYTNAAELLFSANRISQAFEVLIASGDLISLYENVEKHPPALADLVLISQLIDSCAGTSTSELQLEMLALHTEFAARTGNTALGLRAAREILRRERATSAHTLCAVKAISRFIVSRPMSERHQWRDQSAALVSKLEERHRIQAKAFCAVHMSTLPDSRFAAHQLVEDTRVAIRDLELRECVEVQNALAVALFFLGDSRSAAQISREALEAAKTLGDNLVLSQVLNTLGLMLYDLSDPEVETISKMLLPLIEKTGAWRFSYVSHLIPAEFYARQGNAAMSLSASALQEQMILIDSVEIENALYFRRMCANLSNLINENYAAVILEYEDAVITGIVGAEYHIFAILSIAYALDGCIAEAVRTLQKARSEREKLTGAWERRFVVDIIVAEIVALCLVGKWNQAKLLIKDDPLANQAVKSLTAALRLFSDGPPFTGVLSALEKCFDKPYIGLGALLIKRAVTELAERREGITLSPSERDVLRMICLGKSNKEIASSRGRSAETIKRQVASLFKKLDVENRTSAVAVARERGFL